MEALLEAGTETADVLALPKTEEDRRLLASILMSEEEELTPQTVEGAVRALRRIYLRRRLEEVQSALQSPGLPVEERQALLQENVRLKRALMDPGLAEAAGRASYLMTSLPLGGTDVAPLEEKPWNESGAHVI